MLEHVISGFLCGFSENLFMQLPTLDGRHLVKLGVFLVTFDQLGKSWCLIISVAMGCECPGVRLEEESVERIGA